MKYSKLIGCQFNVYGEVDTLLFKRVKCKHRDKKQHFVDCSDCVGKIKFENYGVTCGYNGTGGLLFDQVKRKRKAKKKWQYKLNAMPLGHSTWVK